MKTSYKISLFIVFFMVLFGILAGFYFYNLKHKDLQKVKPDFVLTASDLLEAFETDENEATSKYVNNVIEVTGTILQIKSGENNTLSISLKTESDFSSVICTLEGNPDLSVFNTDEQITIRGECSGFLLDVLLNNCVVVQ